MNIRSHSLFGLACFLWVLLSLPSSANQPSKVITAPPKAHRAFTLAARIADTAETFLFVRETQPNRGAWVDTFNRMAGAPLASNWCMSFVYTMSVYATHHGIRSESPLLRTGAVWRQLQHARRFGSGLQVIPMRQWGKPPTVQGGDIGCMSSRGSDPSLIGGAWTGHTFVIREDLGNRVATTEGNTNNDGSRNGYRVANRMRNKSSILAVIRIIDPQYITDVVEG